MTRALGAGLIAIAGVVMGLRAAAVPSRRVRSISSFITALELIISEITLRRTALGELLAMLADAGGECARVFEKALALWEEGGSRAFAQAWQGALSEQAPFICLKRPEIESLTEFGATIGRYDGESTVKSAEYTRHRLSRILEEAERDRERKTGTIRTLCISAGLVLALILI